MSDVIMPGGRPLTGAERWAFQELGLSGGNWAALVVAPFLGRPGIRPPNVHQRGDCLHLETLRRELRTASGLSEQTGQFWKRLSTGSGPEAVGLAMRLLGWHLATDLPFGKREDVIRLLRSTADEFTTGVQPRAAQLLVDDVRLLVDYMLPCSTFPAGAAPRWVPVPVPAADSLDAIARAVSAPPVPWPSVPADQAEQLLPTLTGLMGEPAGAWWGRVTIGRQAVERGMAALSFAERERLYTEVTDEWRRAHGGDPGGDLGGGIREWVEAVRKHVRLTSTTPEPRHVVAVPGALPPANPPPRGAWRCAKCGTENAAALRSCKGCQVSPLPPAIELRSGVTNKELRLEDGMRVGRAEFRDVFGLPEAGLAAADQFEVVRDEAKGAWLVRPVGATRPPTWYDGKPVGAEGREVAADGVISVAGRLELTVRFV